MDKMKRLITRPALTLLLTVSAFLLAGVACRPSAATESNPELVASPGHEDSRLDDIRLPRGFRIGLYAANVPNARSICRGDQGTIFVGTRSEGSVYALRDTDGDHKVDKRWVIARNLFRPNGIAFKDGSLYLAEINKVSRWDDIENRLDNPGPPILVNDSLPSDRHHGWKYLAFGPDGKLYLPVGAPCNICERLDDPRYASIMRMNPDGSDLEVFASGVRNSVGFAFHPNTGDLWFTENGRDWMGNDSPPDELNHAPRPGMHFGYPYCHAGDTPDPEFGPGHECENYTPPARKLGPHVAALGMKFYTGDMFPKKYQNSIFIAEHGSWNRQTPIGYRITQVRLEGDKAVSYEVFAEGWLQGKGAWGRPVDLLQMPDGSLLLTDDTSDRIYRISYGS